VFFMVSSDEINRRLEAKRRGVKYPKPQERERFGMESSNTKECPSCHTQNPSTAKFCVGCGKKLVISEPEGEVEKEFSPEIKGPEEPTPEKPIQKKHKLTQRPDDFSKSRKLEPIIPPEPEPEPTPQPEPEPAHETTPEPETATNSKQVPPEPVTSTQKPETEPSKPPQVKRPGTIPTPEPKVETTTTFEPTTNETETGGAKEKSDVDPVERIKKAKELLDLGAITQEDFDKIKNKYLDEI
jgi:hypothetical protein